jgi:hypothetical protein
MTKSSRGSSLIQARHSHPHSHSLFHLFRRSPLHGHTSKHQALCHDDANDSAFENHLGANAELDSSNHPPVKRDPSAIAEKVVVNAISGGPNTLVTQVVQTISLVQYVDPWGSPFETKTVYGPPSTVVVDPESGKTVAISIGTQSSLVHGSTPTQSGQSSPSPALTISTALGPKQNGVSSSASATPVYPSVADIRNSTSCKLL